MVGSVDGTAAKEVGHISHELISPCVQIVMASPVITTSQQFSANKRPRSTPTLLTPRRPPKRESLKLKLL